MNIIKAWVSIIPEFGDMQHNINMVLWQVPHDIQENAISINTAYLNNYMRLIIYYKEPKKKRNTRGK